MDREGRALVVVCKYDHIVLLGIDSIDPPSQIIILRTNDNLIDCHGRLYCIRLPPFDEPNAISNIYPLVTM